MNSGELTQAKMEAILGPDSEPFETFLKDYRESSEEAKSMFNLIKEKEPNSLALKLAAFLESSHDHGYYREECAHLLHKLFTDDSWHNRLSVSTQSRIKYFLLHLLPLEEQSEFIIQELCETVSALAVSFLPDNNWHELLPFLYQFLTDPTSNNYLKTHVFYIFSHLAVKIGETIVPCVKYLHSLFRNTLNNDTFDLKVRIAATKAVIKFIQCVPISSNEKERFQQLLPGTLRTLTDALSNSDYAKEVLNIFILLAVHQPKFLRMQLRDVVSTMMEIAEDAKLEDKTRHLAVEFVLSLVEARKKAPGMMRKLPLFTHTFFAILLNLSRDIKDEPSWHSADNICDDAGATDNYQFGLECLGRLSNALGGKTIAPIAMEQLRAYLVSPEWEKRHAALMALVQIAKGSSKVMIKYLEKIVTMVLRSFQDPHPRVRWAAISATHRLSFDLCPYFQEQYHAQVLPALAASMDDFHNPRVQAQAASAFRGYCVSKKEETLVPYLDKILNKLLVLLQNDNQMVKERALKALSFIVWLSKDHFLKYYDYVMPYLKPIVVNANDKYNHILRQFALECISVVVMNASKGKFRDDLEQVMEVLMKLLRESQVKELNTVVYSLQACHRISICMGKDFLPYMSTLMPPLIECAQLELDKTVSSNELDESIHKVKFGDQIILVRGKDLLYGKATACLLLGEFAVRLEEDFYPWISQGASVLVPLLKFYIHHEVREDASYAMPSLLRSAQLAEEKGTAQGGNMPYFKHLSGEIIHALGDALYSEPKTKVCAFLLGELNKCLKICGPLLNKYQIHSIIDEIKHVLIENSRRKGELAECAKSEDFDAEDAELMREEREQEAEVFKYVGYILITLIETLKAAFFPFLDQLSSYLMPTRGEDKIAQERKTCILIFDYVMMHCGEAAIKYHDRYLPFLLNLSNDENPGVRQNALYGLKLCAEYGGSVFKPFIGEALSRINVIITHSNALEPENLGAYDNAVSALGKICQIGKICQFHRESIDSAQAIQAWLNCLPIKNDLDEAKEVHDQLCSMVKRSDKELLGPKYMHIPKVISVFAEVLCAGDDLATKETREHMITLLRHFHKTLSPATWESARSLLLPQQDMELESILSPEEKMLTFQPGQ